eukprot:PRCOL_00002117-RA
MAEEEVDYEAAEEEEEPAAAADEEAAAADGAAAAADEDDDDDEEDLETMKARLKEMEAEAAKLQEMQNKVEQEMGTDKAAGEGEGGAAGANAASREEVDARSVYVGNVDYAVTPEELQVHFQSCGTVNRVTILSDRFGNPKGFAYVEFLEPDAVANALLLAESELHGRQLRVSSALSARAMCAGATARARR